MRGGLLSETWVHSISGVNKAATSCSIGFLASQCLHIWGFLSHHQATGQLSDQILPYLRALCLLTPASATTHPSLFAKGYSTSSAMGSGFGVGAYMHACTHLCANGWQGLSPHVNTQADWRYEQIPSVMYAGEYGV